MISYVCSSKLISRLPFTPSLHASSWNECREDYGRSATCLAIQRTSQSSRRLQVHVVHVGMPQRGVASGKRTHGFKLSKFLNSKKSVLRIQNKDSLCLACALVTDITQQDNDPGWNSIRMGRKEQRWLAQQLHLKADVEEGLCGSWQIPNNRPLCQTFQRYRLKTKARKTNLFLPLWKSLWRHHFCL